MSDETLSATELVEAILREPHIPRATYRFQFNQQFTFQDALSLVDYVHELGISDIYTSPLFRPRSGSTHGYDVVNYNELNPALGTDEDFEELVAALHEREMGLLLDVVPNHMGVDTDNAWWMDVLKHGPSSVYAHYFDINWKPVNRALDNKVMLPVLGDHFGVVLESGAFELVYWHGDFYLHYYEHQFPITPHTYEDILTRAHKELVEAGVDEPTEMELLSIITALQHLPPYATDDEQELITLRREQTIARWRILGLWDRHEGFRNALALALGKINGTPGEPSSFNVLDDILNRQPYRLSYWRVAADEINYRRFFDINDLAAIRIEELDVFEDTHRTVLRWLAEGKVTGLRLDHPDGLWDPPAYFARVQVAYLMRKLAQQMDDSEAELEQVQEVIQDMVLEEGASHWPVYVVAEKILSETEPLPYTWAVYGTTGYDFMMAVNNLFVAGENEAAFDALYEDFTGEMLPFAELTDMTQKKIMADSLASELEARSAELARIVEGNRLYRGFTQNSLSRAMGEIIANLSIYRTYITGPHTASERDRHYITEAVETAKRNNPGMPQSIFDFLRETLLLENIIDFTASQQQALKEFVMKFQQITGPVMAKSVEDTAFYIYNRLVSLNEVGGHPEQFGLDTGFFHRHNANKAFPHTMLSTSTHDTKRSEDVRARINILSEIPNAWRDAIQRWSEINIDAKTEVNEELAPAPNDEYLIYQTLIGAFPYTEEELNSFKGRVIAYMHKAINEAKVRSNWVNPNDAYAEAIAHFVTTALDDPVFREAFDPFQQRVAFYGHFNSLAQTLLKLTVPGVPDIYQGNELWDYSLVDPDNRRPVDYEKRRTMLTEMKALAEDDLPGLLADMLENIETGMVKLFVSHRVLDFRREHWMLFRDGDYVPVEVEGVKAKHVVAFLRRTDDEAILVVVPRLVVGLTEGREVVPAGRGVWRQTNLLLPAEYQGVQLGNIFTGADVVPVVEDGQVVLPVAELLEEFPVGVLQIG
jgi:(1->4)-alpha-D-glucan 1-alpha-D-glucosylmutase